MAIKIAAISVARSDFGRMELLYQALQESSDFELFLAIGGAHYEGELGHSIDEIKSSRISSTYFLPSINGDFAERSANILTETFKWLTKIRPDAFLILGDRYEMLSAAQAATMARVPIIHIGGGHITLGAIDEQIRHAISKLSSIHMVASEACRRRVLQMYESESSIYITGAPEIDILKAQNLVAMDDFYKRYQLNKNQAFILVTLHPETGADEFENQRFASIMEDVLKRLPQQILITSPCLDPGYKPFLNLCQKLPTLRRGCTYVPSLGMTNYISAMHYAKVMVGNSSSGIIEAGSVGLPVVNIGKRQLMRDHAENVIHCGFELQSIERAIDLALTSEFEEKSSRVTNPYGEGFFVDKVMRILNKLTWPLNIKN